MLRKLLVLACLFVAAPLTAQVFTVEFPASQSARPLDGRLFLILSNDGSSEPRMQVDDTLKTQQLFGMTMDGWKPGEPARFTNAAQGYPARELSQLKPGDYYVQGLLNLYQTFHRSDGSVVKLAPDRGEGQHWNLAPGNLYSKPVKIHVDGGSQAVRLALDQTIPPIKPEPDTQYIRHIRIQSKLLSDFWGTPMYLSAIVMVPWGFDEHPAAHYPLMIFHDHFAAGMMDFRETPPDPDLKPDYSDRFHLAGYNRIVQQEGYANYQKWIAPEFPRFLVVKLNHANPYYDDSYAVNSANLGPYGDAIETELVPAIEKQFRAIGAGWARFVYGGSTGGWESLAVQIFYPTHYNGAFVACPDPVDFHAFETADLYDRDNVFVIHGAQRDAEQPSMRNYLGQTFISFRANAAFEATLGDHGRSGEQFDIWQAVYGPEAKDGYPAEIFDKQTGAVNKTTAQYWHDHYDLDAILQRDWNKLGPDLQGKIHIYVGEADTYFLNNAVYLMDDFLKTTGTPGHGVPYDGEVLYGPRAEHCWNGDFALPNALSRLHYNFQYLPQMMQRMEKTAPPGADLTSWRY